jgi:hypothetical protein
MTTAIDLICFNCKHKFEFGMGCEAFNDGFGIPDEILMTNQHSKPLPDQGNDIVFEPKETN